MLARGRVPYDKYRRTPSDPEGSSGSQVPWVLWSTRLFYFLRALTFNLLVKIELFFLHIFARSSILLPVVSSGISPRERASSDVRKIPQTNIV